MVCFGHSDALFPDKPLEFPADYNEENWRGLIAVMLPLTCSDCARRRDHSDSDDLPGFLVPDDW